MESYENASSILMLNVAKLGIEDIYAPSLMRPEQTWLLVADYFSKAFKEKNISILIHIILTVPFVPNVLFYFKKK